MIRIVLALLFGVVATMLAASGALARSPEAGAVPTVMWLRDGQVAARVLGTSKTGAESTSGPRSVPMGSLWKLFVFAYAIDRNMADVPYVCRADDARSPEDRYCCEPGDRIGRDEALAKSCGRYFDPARLGIAADDWRAHWQAQRAPAWLAQLDALEPATRIPSDELLAALDAMSPAARHAARRALLDVSINGYGRNARAALGTGARFKTYSWHRADRPDTTIGGAAGWLADGTPFWFGAQGSSRAALTKWAEPLAMALPAPRWRRGAPDTPDPSCVHVEFFKRYPIRAVWLANENKPASRGVLPDSYRIEFENGVWLRVVSTGQLQLDAGERPVISGRFTLNEYVARVIEREGGAGEREAARALAVAARTYVIQNAAFDGGCWRIEDSSRTQRVSANPPSAEAVRVAWFTDELILRGTEVRYHRDAAGTNRMAWVEALAQSKQGKSYEHILAAAYPSATLAALSGREDCARMEAAETWLMIAAMKWQRRLRNEAGFEPPGSAVRVCVLIEGHPYADQQRLRIYARGWRNLEERITLAHEYLHLAFRHHPRGADEAFVERIARELVGGGS